MPGPVNTNPSRSTASSPDPTEETRRVRNVTQHASDRATSAHGANLTPPTDPFLRYGFYATSLDHGGEICVGEIIDGAVTANCYRVNVERLRAPVMAVPLTSTSQSVLGVTELQTYAPGTRVLLYLHYEMLHAFILGAMPRAATVGAESIHDFISQTSRKRVDEAHKRYLKLEDSGYIANWSTWKPFDGTHASEWGGIASTGLKLTLDDFMVQMAVNEFCGVFGFYHDQLLRVAGYNMQTWTAGHERDAYMDQAEYNDFQGYAPYPWEAVGMLNLGAGSPVQQYEPEVFATAGGKPYYSRWENKYENQQPFHRTQKFYGYYGQGSRTVVCAPPSNLDWWTYRFKSTGSPNAPYESTVENELAGTRKSESGEDKEKTQEEEQPAIGLAEDNTAMDGRRFIASAKGITISKRMLLPVPSRVRRPEDGNGDDADTNYKAAGIIGADNAPEHTITGDFRASDNYPNLQRAAGVLDLHSYLFNYVGLHPFFWHAQDYKTWEQSELEYASSNHIVPDYSRLSGSMYLNEPGHINLNIDHRYKSQNFYQTESFISLLEDGAVVIGDGYGAEIRMCAGSITISAPGDVWLKPGKNAQIWAGRDFITRAHGSVDISTSEKNIRIKAEQNVMILAGNESSSREGGVLIESRAKSPTYNFDNPGDGVIFGGVVLRARDSEVIGLGKNIYMRTTGGYEGTGAQAGVITLDASRGSGDLVTKSRNIYSYVGLDGSIFHIFRKEADDSAVGANLFKKGQTFLNGPLYINGPVVADGGDEGYGVICRGGIYTNGGAVASRKGGVLAPCPPGSLCAQSIDNAIEQIETFIESDLPSKLNELDTETWAALWYDASRPGNASTIKKLEFSFRTDTDYRVPDFELFEDRWQQMARLAAQKLDTWTEKPVLTSAGVETWPFPGKAKLVDEQAFVMHDFSIVEKNDAGGLRDKDRRAGNDLAEAYKKPAFSDAKRETIASKYMIIK